VDEAVLDTFGPLGPVPALDITLPLGRITAADDAQTTSVSPVRIPGGVLLAVGASSYGYFEGAILTVINTDGSIRWRRCLDRHVSTVSVAPSSSLPTEAIIGSYTATGDEPPAFAWQVVSLLDGSDTRTVADLAVGAGIDATTAAQDRAIAWWWDTQLVLGPAGERLIDVATDRLLRIDLTTMTASAVPFPADADGVEMFRLDFDITDDGRLVELGASESGTLSVPVAIELGDGWSTDEADLLAGRPFDLDFVFDDSTGAQPLVALDALGRVLWQRDDITTFGGEGFRFAIDGDVAIVAGCTPSGILDDPCATSSLYGIDLATGATRWQLDGARGVAEVADGFALITEAYIDGGDSPAWIMIDTATGNPVADDQRWADPSTFENQCCGGDELVFTTRKGGVVIAVYERHVRVWYPRSISHGTTVVAVS
jgi:hypothetical protein